MDKNKQLLAEKVGECIHIARRRNKITQEKLAERVGLSTNFISLIERGEEIPSIYTLDKISKVFDLRLNELLSISDV